MHRHDILKAWIVGIVKTGSEQEHVEKLADVLESLLNLPQAKTLPGYQEYDRVLQNTRPGKYAGVDALTDALIDLTCKLERK